MSAAHNEFSGPRVPNRIVQTWVLLSGALLLFGAMVLVCGNFASRGLVSATDPILSIPMRNTFWLVAVVCLMAGTYCLFGRKILVGCGLVLWLSLNFLVYQYGLSWLGLSGGMKGYYVGVAASFDVSTKNVDVVAKLVCFILVAGSSISLSWSRFAKKSFWVASDYLKTSCPSCGGHIQFASRSLGRQQECPHCATVLTLRGPDETLKMNCFFCKGHIEFPAHALGTKMQCPHCKMDITLMETK